MDTRRSFYLVSKEDDFAEPAKKRLDFSDVPLNRPANDNLRTKDRLSARCASLLRSLFAPQGLDP
jgi:hypothetical protein